MWNRAKVRLEDETDEKCQLPVPIDYNFWTCSADIAERLPNRLHSHYLSLTSSAPPQSTRFHAEDSSFHSSLMLSQSWIPMITYHGDYYDECTGLGREATAYIAALQEQLAIYMKDHNRKGCDRPGDDSANLAYWKNAREFFFGVGPDEHKQGTSPLLFLKKRDTIWGHIMDIKHWHHVLADFPEVIFLHMRASSFPKYNHQIVSSRRRKRRIGWTVGRSLSEFSDVDDTWVAGLTWKESPDEFWVTADFFWNIYRRRGVREEKLRWMPLAVDAFNFDPVTRDTISRNYFFSFLFLDFGVQTKESKKNSFAKSTPHGRFIVDNQPGLTLPDLHERFVILSSFKWEDRKGWDILLEAYFLAFLKLENATSY